MCDTVPISCLPFSILFHNFELLRTFVYLFPNYIPIIFFTIYFHPSAFLLFLVSAHLYSSSSLCFHVSIFISSLLIPSSPLPLPFDTYLFPTRFIFSHLSIQPIIKSIFLYLHPFFLYPTLFQFISVLTPATLITFPISLPLHIATLSPLIYTSLPLPLPVLTHPPLTSPLPNHSLCSSSYIK